MNKHQLIEKGLTGLFLGAVPVIVCFLAGWWGSIPFVPENQIFIWALVGLALGILLDIVFLKKWLANAYTLSGLAWIGLYLFYSVGFFGLFMGVPLFNLLLAIPAGFLVGARLTRENPTPSEWKKTTFRVNLFVSGVLLLVCIASAAIALIDPYTASNLEGLLGMHFKITMPMLIAVILLGGAGMIVVQWWLMKKSIQLACRLLSG